MSRALLSAAVLALVIPAVAAASLPSSGALVPGRSLGGIQLGETAASVRAALGSGYGVCRGCANPTWYFTYRRFDTHGLAVELSGGRVSAVYTLWQPPGWRAPRGLVLGAPEAQITLLHGALVPVSCSGYDALVQRVHGTQTVYYVVSSKLWGFGLFRTAQSPCR